jgi:CHASE3 domain sensor protein
MFLTWLTSAFIAGEVVLYLVFVLADRGRPRPVASGWFYFLLCIGLFAMAGTSLLAYVDTLHKVRVLDAIGVRFRTATELMRDLRDMEIGQRGYLLTGRDSYLEPYLTARTRADSDCAAVHVAYAGSDDREQAENLRRLGRLKIEEMASIVDLKREGKPYEALEKVQADTGKNLMDLSRAASEDLLRRQLAAYTQVKTELYHVAHGRIWMAAMVLAGSVLHMLIGATYGWPARPHGPCPRRDPPESRTLP